jgi:hypothetical protein
VLLGCSLFLSSLLQNKKAFQTLGVKKVKILGDLKEHEVGGKRLSKNVFLTSVFSHVCKAQMF